MAGGSRLRDWNEQANQPAAPQGQQQAARAAEGYQGGDERYEGSRLGKWTAENGYVDQASRWYTGANSQGTSNGWNTDFANDFIAGQDKAANEGRLGSYFTDAEATGATGVVTWDHEGNGKTFAFGDIYEKGKFKGNVYDQYDRAEADLMMSDWLFDGKTKAEIFGASDNVERLQREVESKREMNRVEIPKSISRMEFQSDVDKREKEFREGVGVDEAIPLATAAGGAAIGSVFGPLGTIIGGAGGLIGGYLNKDSLTEQAARAYEITALSTKENGLVSGVFEGVHQWSAVAGRSITPFSNLVQGAYDWKEGEIGDGTSEFYRVDKAGDRQAGKTWQALDVAATVGDSFLQFASPLGATLYMGQMSGTILGETGSLITSGGESFDERSGSFDNIFTDDEGNFDLGSAAAGIGKIGIDVVQLGFAKGLTNKADSSLMEAGKDAFYKTGLNSAKAKLPQWAGGLSSEAKDIVAAGGKVVEVGGKRTLLNAEGKVAKTAEGKDVLNRATLSMLAPSEQLNWVSAKAIARRERADKGGAVSSDDFYKAANSLAIGEKKFSSALINGLGEGYEEAVQAVLEPLSHNANFTGEEIWRGFVGGFGAGTGISMATSWRGGTADDKLFEQARIAHEFISGGEKLTKAEWKKKTAAEKQNLSNLSAVHKELMSSAYKVASDEMGMTMVGGVVEETWLRDAIEREKGKQLNTLTNRTDQPLLMVGFEDAGTFDITTGEASGNSMPNDAVGSSGAQLLRNFANRLSGLATVRKQLARDIAAKSAEVDADPENLEVAQMRDELTRQFDTTESMLDLGRFIELEIRTRIENMYVEGRTIEEDQADAAVINMYLRDIFHEREVPLPGFDGEITPADRRAMARAISQVVTRDPADGGHNFQILVPQISAALTNDRADNLVQISHAILPSIRGDYDGDKIRTLNQLILDDTEFINLRSGATFLGAGSRVTETLPDGTTRDVVKAGSVNIPAPDYEKWQIKFLREAWKSGNKALASRATGTLVDIGTAVRNRYSGVVPEAVLDSVYSKFEAAVRTGDPAARKVLLDGLANEAGGAITEFSRDNLSNEWLWIDQVVRSHLQQFQKAYAAHNPAFNGKVDTTTVAVNKQSAEMKEVQMQRAATLGATLGLLLPGESMFRKFQDLHYASLNNQVLSAALGGDRNALVELAQLYTSIGQGVSTSAMEKIHAKDEITRRVLARLDAFAEDAVAHYTDPNVARELNKAEAMVVLANVQVADVYTNAKGDVVTSGNMISMTQMLLKQEIAADEKAKRQILEASPELQAKHARLKKLTVTGGHGGEPNTAERAFAEVFSSQPLYDLIGEAAEPFGEHLTVEQWLRMYTANDEITRREDDSSLKREAAYLEAEKIPSMPYGLDQISKLSAYRSVVDALLGAGHARDKEQQARSQRVSDDFKQSHDRIRTAVRQYEKLSPRKDGETAELHVQRLMATHPDFARDVMALLPMSRANGVMRIEGNQVWTAKWVYKMLAESDAKTAEAIYWRNLLLAEIKSFGIQNLMSTEGATEDENGQRYDHLPRRMHRIVYQLSQRADGQILMAKFIKELTATTDVNAFIKWVNTTPGIRGTQAPLTAWVDDVAEYDPDKAQGGWTTQLAGAELRTAVNSLKLSSKRLVTSLSQEQQSLEKDLSTLLAIERVDKYEGDPATGRAGDKTVKVSTNDRALYNQFKTAIEESGKLVMGLGPQAMIYQTLGAARGFYEQAHTKGVTPGNVRAQGLMDAARDAMGYVTNYERLLDSMTTVNLDAVGASLEQVSKDGGRTMDDHGRVVEWEKPTVSQMVALMRDADTRPLARAVLFPQVMEKTPDGNIRPQLLVDKDLAGFLSGATVRSLFAKDKKLSNNKALRYMSLLEAEARKHQGHFAVQRAVNEMVIAKITASTTEMSEDDLERLVVEAYVEGARISQQVSAMSPAPIEPGTDPLEQVKADAAKANRTRQAARTFGIESGDPDVDVVVDTRIGEFLAAREQEMVAEKSELAILIDSDPAQAEMYAAQAEAAQADFDNLKLKIDAMRDVDQVKTVVDMFTIDDEIAGSARKKDQLVDFIDNHPGPISQVKGAMVAVRLLNAQRRDSGRNGQVELDPAEWDILSRAAISVYLNELSTQPSIGVTLALFPDANHANDQRYFDKSFNYLMDPWLDPDSPIVKAGRDMFQKSGSMLTAMPEDILEVLGDTIYKDFALGQWTEEVPRFSIEANQRLDSASAESGIAIPGNSPKRQAVKSAAYRRTFEIPGEELLSTTTLSLKNLGLELFDNVKVLKAGQTEPTDMAVAQLNNRFAQSATVTFTDGSTVELLADTEAGRRWYGSGDVNQSVANSGYYEMHLERLQAAATAAALEKGLSPDAGTVEIKFFHPDTQPATPEWFNNIYFEGTSFKLDTDQSASLIETLWFALGGLNPEGQAQALDASKTGKQAMQVIKTLTNDERKALEANWATSLAAVLRAKTRTVLDTNLGFNKLEAEYYNAIYKDLKGKHFVRGTAPETGEPVLLAAETVIALQEAGQELGIENAELWIPSDDVLRSMLGEQGTQGVRRIYNDQLDFDLSQVPTYRGVTSKMVEQFAVGISGEKIALEDTRVTARAHQSQLVIREYLNAKELDAFKVQMQIRDTMRTGIWEARGENEEKVPYKANLEKALLRGYNMLFTENIAFDWKKLGIPFIGARDANALSQSQNLLKDLSDVISTENKSRTGWIYRESGKTQSAVGELSRDIFTSTLPLHRQVAPEDLVVIELDSFEGDTEKLRQRIGYFAGRGATIVLGSGDGTTTLLGPARTFLEEMSYDRMAGSGHVYQPADLSTRYQNLRARASAMLETRGVSQKNHIAMLLVQGLPITEGNLWVRPGDERLGALTATDDLLPTTPFVNYNVPRTPDQIEKVREHLRGFRSDEERTFLRNMAVGTLKTPEERIAAGAEWDKHFDALLRQFDNNDGSVLPAAGDTFGKGYIVPLIDNQNNVILYRHGHKAPINREAIEAMQALPRPTGSASKVAVYSAKTNPKATVHDGEVLAIRPRGQFGMEIEQNISQQVFGQKIQLEWNGQKYTALPMPDSVKTPEFGFMDGWAINGISDLDTTMSKESFDGLVDNHRNAFAYFGIDFLPDVTEFFYPGYKTGAVTDRNKAEQNTRRLLRAMSTQNIMDYEGANELLNSGNIGSVFTSALAPFSVAQRELLGVDASWLARLNEPTVEAQIAKGMLIYLSTRGAEVEYVLNSGGFNDTSATPDSQSRLMPQLFTQIFDNSPRNSELRAEMNRRFNAQLSNPSGSNVGYRLLDDWTFQILNENPEDNLEGMLQIAEAHASDDNPVTNGMSFDEAENQTVSAHSAAIMQQSIGARTASLKELSESSFFADGKITHFDQDLVDGGLWRMMMSLPAGDQSAARWRDDMPAEAEYRGLARDARVQFRRKIDKTEENGWTAKQLAQYEETAREIMRTLRLKESQWEMVDGWVRQHYGKPFSTTDENVEVNGKQAVEVAKDFILWNVTNRLLPTVGAQTPVLDVQDLQMIYRANHKHSAPWWPRESMDENSAFVTDWDGWVELALDDSLQSSEIFDDMFLLATDGFLHTYQNATRSLMAQPVTMNPELAGILMDPETNRLIVSISPDVNQLTMDPEVMNIARAGLADVMGGQRIAGRFQGKYPPNSELAKQMAKRKKWRLDNDVPFPIEVTMKNFRKNGANHIQRGTDANALARSLINIRIGTALINPALWISMGPESLWRGAIDRASNILTGQATTGVIGRRQAQLSQTLQNSRLADALDAMGLVTAYSPEQLKSLGTLYDVMGQRTEFKAMVYSELNFQRPHNEVAIGKFEKGTAAYARFGSRVQDPTWGVRGKTLARKYMEAAMQHIAARPTANAISTDTLILRMKNDPLYLKNNFPEAHKAASAAIAQARSLKPTVASLLMRGIYEPLSQSSNPGVNFASNVLLKMPLLFSGYAMNVVTTITGMQGFNDWAAMYFHGKDKWTWVSRVQAAMRGEEFSGATEQFDMSEVIEGIDLSRSFIKGGLTHTGLFAMGMAMGGLGLTGEDEEERRRRRAAELQGAGFVYDPRRLENDFRNADALYFGGTALQMPWIAKQFISPIIGMERFFDTGDFRQVTWGFQDAVGSFPIINSLMWHDAVETAQDFVGDADEAAKSGQPKVASNLLISAAGVYERMLFENSFVNQIYQAQDRYDRDPFAQTMIDSDEVTQVDAMGQPRETEEMRQYIDEDGNIKEGYVSRSAGSAALHQLTENRFTLAAGLSLFTGLGDSSFLRNNMVIKTRSFDAPIATNDEAEAAVRSLMMTQKDGMLNLTPEESLNRLRNAGVGGKYARNADLEPLAAQDSAGMGYAPLSIMTENDREELTKDGATAIMRSLAKQSVKVGDPSLQGIHITYDQRQQIASEWTKELIQEGVDLGLDQTKATARMKRLMYGPKDDESIMGLADILFDKSIPYTEQLEYNQLNTTYVKGPDGRPWATGFGRSTLTNAFIPEKLVQPDKGLTGEYTGVMSIDERFNSVDRAAGQNLGLRALEPTNPVIPTDKEIGELIAKAVEDAAKGTYTPFEPFASSGGGGGGGGYGGGGGGGGYSPNIYFSRMDRLPESRSPYSDSIPFINTSNPILRRADVRRERVWSERGRLKPWQ